MLVQDRVGLNRLSVRTPKRPKLSCRAVPYARRPTIVPASLHVSSAFGTVLLCAGGCWGCYCWRGRQSWT